MRAIMLDFDGVAHPVSDIADWRTLNLSSADLPHLVRERRLLRWLPLLADALEDHPDVVIVVHSGWRGKVGNMQMREFLGPLADRFVGVTSVDLTRHVGIQEFVLRAGFEQYLVIDDAVQEFPKNFQNLLVTHPERGLTDPDVLAGLRQWLETTAPALIAVPGMTG